ncbi:MAG: hypothetical protein C0501_21105 [Isosphaera sp.]|nr:hypothetical protein [Isosphaera sp.]
MRRAASASTRASRGPARRRNRWSTRSSPADPARAAPTAAGANAAQVTAGTASRTAGGVPAASASQWSMSRQFSQHTRANPAAAGSQTAGSAADAASGTATPAANSRPTSRSFPPGGCGRAWTRAKYPPTHPATTAPAARYGVGRVRASAAAARSAAAASAVASAGWAAANRCRGWVAWPARASRRRSAR